MPTYRPAALAAALLLTAAAPLASTAAIAAPAVDLMFGDHAVIQRDAPIRISGTGDASAPVTVTFAGETRSVRADAKGRWSAEFAPRGAGGPYRIEVRSRGGAAAAEDVMVGDVWLCSGQSNMEYPLPRALGYGEPQAETDSNLRLTKVPQQLSDKPQESFAKP